MATETAPAPTETDAEHDHHPAHLEHHFVSSEHAVKKRGFADIGGAGDGGESGPEIGCWVG